MKETTYFRGNEYIIKYKHERMLDDCGNPINRGGKTISYIVLKYSDNGEAIKTICAESKCNKADSFDKRMGRLIAKGRLLKKIKEHEDASLM